MSRPRLLDLFGGEGGGALGWAEAGFRVDCVENDPERIANHVRHEAITVHKGDATTWPLDGYDVVAGSPPCTGWTSRAPLADLARGRGAGTAWMLPHTIARCEAWARETGGLWVIENVEGARRQLPDPIRLCGTHFGLTDKGWWLRRHRLFASNFPLVEPGPCTCLDRRIIGVYGDLTANDRRCAGRRPGRPNGDMRAGVERARRLMGMPWASPQGLTLAIPPAYTRFVGAQLLVRGDDGEVRVRERGPTLFEALGCDAG